MQNNIFRYSEHHIQFIRRLATVLALIQTCLFLLLLLLEILDRKWIVVVIFSVACIALSVRSFKAIRSANTEAANMREMRIELSPASLRVCGPDGIGEVPLQTISAIQIVRRHGSVRAVSVNLPSTDTIVITGIDRLEEFATELSRYLGQAKVGEYRWWQAHPT